MSRSFFISAALAVCVGAPVPALAQGPPQAGPRPLTVATYNIHHGTGNDTCTTPPPQPGQPPNADCGLDLERIASVIEQLGADVVGLQEVDRFWARSGGVDQPTVLADRLGMHMCYGANLVHQPDAHATVPHEYGTAILSRFPILSCENLFLPKANPPAGEQRGLLQARVNVRGVPLMFLNTHLHTAVADRRVQVQAIADWLDANPSLPVLVGDLNARPAETTLPPLFSRLVDVWPAAHPDPSEPGFTFPALPTRPPDRRIDYILTDPRIAIDAARVDVSDLTALAADHYPVVASIALPGSEVGIGRPR